MNTTITISTNMKDQLNEFRNKGESYNKIITRLLDYAKESQLQKILMNTTNCITIDEARERVKKKWSKNQ
jgi:hypothetical protein